jgi:hypothetical protein
VKIQLDGGDLIDVTRWGKSSSRSQSDSSVHFHLMAITCVQSLQEYSLVLASSLLQRNKRFFSMLAASKCSPERNLAHMDKSYTTRTGGGKNKFLFLFLMLTMMFLTV